MKVNFNLLKEKRKPNKVKKKSKKTKVKYKINSKKNFDSDFVVYDDQFDNQVRNFNNQSYKNQTPFSSDGSKVALDDVPEDMPDNPDDETETLPDIPLIKVKKQERERKENRLKNTKELDTNQLEDYYIGPGGADNEESVESEKLEIISGRQLYSVWIYRESIEDGKEIIHGSIINIPKQGYLISTSPNAFDKKTSSEKLKNISSPEDMPRITKQNWKDALGSDESNFKKFKYSYKEAVDEIFYFKRLRLPDELSDDQKQFRVMPDNFEDAKGEMIPITIQEYDRNTRDKQFSRILGINYFRQMDNNSNIGYDIDDETYNELLKKYDPKENKDVVKETHINGYDDICSIAAMIMVETNASSEKSPFGTTAVALARSDSSSWPTRLHDIVQGPATDYVPWNLDKEYAERYNSNKEYIHSILREETQIGELASKIYGESFDDNSALKKKYKARSDNNKNRRRRAVDYALESILRKDELLVRYREATSFIHPESMQKKQNPTKKDRIPYDFFFERLYEVAGPNKVIDRKNFEIVQIENNPKLGIHKTPRYLPKWVIESIKKGEAFFIPNETALFIK